MQVSIVPGCITCGVCESICPEVFTVIDTSIADNSQIPGNEDACREASKACPVDVIVIQD
ncbi:MAG: ferredoxin [Cyanobacteria bacterium]|nr:ferredoxin [Cyanobacteriota bacterium]